MNACRFLNQMLPERLGEAVQAGKQRCACDTHEPQFFERAAPRGSAVDFFSGIVCPQALASPNRINTSVRPVLRVLLDFGVSVTQAAGVQGNSADCILRVLRQLRFDSRRADTQFRVSNPTEVVDATCHGDGVPVLIYVCGDCSRRTHAQAISWELGREPRSVRDDVRVEPHRLRESREVLRKPRSRSWGQENQRPGDRS